MVKNIQQPPPLKHADYAAAVQHLLKISQRYLAIRGTATPALMHPDERERALFAQGFRLGPAPQSFMPYFKQNFKQR